MRSQDEQHFTNEFRVLKVPSTLQIFQAAHDQEKYRGTKFDFGACGAAAAELSNSLKMPIACFGTSLITLPGASLYSEAKVTVKYEGIPVDTVVTPASPSTVDSNSPAYLDMVSRFLNRQIASVMLGLNFHQDGRFFYEEKPAMELGKLFRIYRGAYAAARVYSADSAVVVIDPGSENRSSQTLLDGLKTELRKRGLESWRDAKDYAREINGIFRSRAYRLRSAYTEVVGSHADPEHNSYRFKEFDFSAGVGDDADQPRSPLTFHRRFGRNLNADQPIAKVVARGGFEVSHAPELLEIQPSTDSMKRISDQFSKKAAAISLMGSQDRYYASVEYAQPLIDARLISDYPLGVEAQYCGPVVLALEGDYLDVRTNRDFRRFYEKGRLLSKPTIDSVHVFCTRTDRPLADELTKTLVETAKEFGLVLPVVQMHAEGPDDVEDFSGYVIDTALKGKFGRHDLALILHELEDPESDELYYRVKGYSLYNQIFPTQFFKRSTVETQRGKNLKSNLVYTVLPQLVAKLGGVPFGLRPGFAPPGSIFIGLDRYRDPYSRQASTNAAVAIFDERGTYIYANATSFDAAADDLIRNPGRLFEESLRFVSSKGVPLKTVYFLRDTGLGKMVPYLQEEAEQAEMVAEKFGAESAYITANKSSHLRLYQGDPRNALMASRTPPFTVVREMGDPNQFMVVSTEPIFEKAAQRELGTPKPVVYDVLSLPKHADVTEVKEVASKAIAWLCRHSWVSPSSTRLPVPLDYADKLAYLVAMTGKPLSPEAADAPLYI